MIKVTITKQSITKRATKSEDAPKLTNHNLFGFINSHEWDQIVNMIDGTKDVDTSDAWQEKESLVVCTDEHFDKATIFL